MMPTVSAAVVFCGGVVLRRLGVMRRRGLMMRRRLGVMRGLCVVMNRRGRMMRGCRVMDGSRCMMNGWCVMHYLGSMMDYRRLHDARRGGRVMSGMHDGRKLDVANRVMGRDDARLRDSRSDGVSGPDVGNRVGQGCVSQRGATDRRRTRQLRESQGAAC